MSAPEHWYPTARLILAALNPNPDGADMTDNPKPPLRPGQPVDMSPEAVAARRAAVIARLKDSHAGWLRTQADRRDAEVLDEEDP